MSFPIGKPPNRWSQCVVSIIFAAVAFGCGSAEDRAFETKLGTVAAHRAEHPHYPVVVFGDFGSDNPPLGILVDVYGPYIHETTKVNPALTAIGPGAATNKLEQTFERAIQGIRAAEATTPAPTPLQQKTIEWKAAPHPKAGTYTIRTRFGSATHSFTVPYDGSGQSATETRQLTSDAAIVVQDGVKAQNAALNALATPSGFILCTLELLKAQNPNRPVDPHLTGGPLLLTPVDTALATKGLERSIRKLLDSTSKINPAPSAAHLTVQGLGLEKTYEIPLSVRGAEESAVKAVLQELRQKIDDANRE